MSEIDLFQQASFSDFLYSWETELNGAIDGYDRNRLLNTPTLDLTAYFAKLYRVEIPVLREDLIQLEQHEIQLDLRDDTRHHHLRNHLNPVLRPGSRLTFVIPFEGHRSFFSMNTGAKKLPPPRGEVRETELLYSVDFLDHATSNVEAMLKQFLFDSNWYLGNMQGTARLWNRALEKRCCDRIDNRKQRLLKDQGLAAQLGIPLRSRGEQKTSYAPELRRKLALEPPPSSGKPFAPEPSLDNANYELILSVLQRMGEVMDRSPSAFSTMQEEDLRTHFLVQLNGAFEIPATAETFNAYGKTDIYLRFNGGNVFVAECKFWSGEKAFGGTIDQLIGYITWRDTKTAILLFNRNKDFDDVVCKAKRAAGAHPRFKRHVAYAAANGFRGVYSHPDDPSREVTITTIVFDVPK